ncbi:LacI family DNA-binding transcriptional regulator [Bifidobacterium sp. ESL0682]|uniref:LacI family DNA-binding transcriptional regulator n=1 Tax=Bifidobacterium sp. ESL0682 TaxID=2983212 RepID=UPI0023F8559D|nr:LacI family DNA-binding transcriptional regulator [Bifidobacterium sp. ESL0682]WEV41865.1 LacI family DNA-binding transcriptional regulator [Bifidobacterium sp. ESL0682]
MTKQGRRPTRDDVAKKAGTSTAVVSYVINNGPRPVSKATREKVLRAIRETGYRPNTVAQSLASGNSETFALLVPDMTNPFLAQLARALGHECLLNNKTLLLGDAEDNAQHEVELLEAFQRQQVAGLVWYGVDQPLPLEVIRHFPRTAVLLNQPEAAEPTAQQDGRRIRVTIDEYQQAYMATEHLASHHRRHIAIVMGPTTRLNSRERLRGWKDALHKAGLEPGQEIVTPYSREGGFEATSALHDDVDAVFTANTLQAIGLLAGLAEQGRTVPDDIAVATMNATDAARYLVPSLTSVQLPSSSLAVSIIHELLGEEHSADDTISAAPLLIRRHSCGCEQPSANNH